MMVALPKILLLVFAAPAFLPCQQPEHTQAPNTGTLTVTLGPPGIVIDPRSVGDVPVRLCSLDRVLQATPDQRGAFTFSNVPAGTYSLLAGNPLWSFFTVENLEIEGGKAQSVSIGPNHDQTDSPCLRDTKTLCVPATYTITYSQPAARKSGEIAGQAFGIGARRRGLTNARIEVFAAGGKTAAYVATADRHGRFHIDMPPGTYTLTMSRKGFHDLRIPDFLVPRENETNVILVTERTNAVIVCQ